MQTVTLAFHDVVEDLRSAEPIASGHGLRYTLDLSQFRNHLQAIVRGAGPDAVRQADCGGGNATERPLFLTFDDGAVSSFTLIAPELDRLGWPGHFLITSGWVSERGFMNPAQIRSLAQRGHIIGTHSCTHPQRMSQLGSNDLRREWAESCDRLSQILGRPITIGSVPGGYFSRRVAEAAAASGIKLLFTSEPTVRVTQVDGCWLMGRYAIRQNTRSSFSEAIASGSMWVRGRQSATWALKKAAKKVTGRFYERLCDVLLHDHRRTHRPSA